VDEMLIQHILTERLIREIFDNPEFVRHNVIAAEVEKVMLANGHFDYQCLPPRMAPGTLGATSKGHS
jgi:hypothetical protein